MKQYRITAAAFMPKEPEVPDAYINPEELKQFTQPAEKPALPAGFPTSNLDQPLAT